MHTHGALSGLESGLDSPARSVRLSQYQCRIAFRIRLQPPKLLGNVFDKVRLRSRFATAIEYAEIKQMRTRNPILANSLGVISLLCNLPFWVAFAFGLAHPCVDSGAMSNFSVNSLALGVVLGIIAAFKGSGLWVLAATLPVVSLVAGVFITINVVGLFPCGM
jgi:hypothetical protein